jgi:hypothetical protein
MISRAISARPPAAGGSWLRWQKRAIYEGGDTAIDEGIERGGTVKEQEPPEMSNM